MKPKTLVPLVVILAILAVLVAVLKSNDQPPSITEEVKLTPLLPEGLSTDDIAKIEVYAGGAADDKLVLAKNESKERWEVATHFDAPAKQSNIDTLLEDLLALKGEFRATAQTESDLEAYDLSDQAAFHVFGYGKDSDEPLFHLLAGKSPGYGTVFMRAADSNEIQVTDVDLRRQAGIYGDDRAEAPKANTWLDKQILKLEKDSIRRIALTLPDKEVVFEYREKPVEPTPEKEGQEEGEGEAIIAPPPPVEYEWVVASGGVGSALKETGLTSLINKLANLSGTDIVDPAKKDEWRLETPDYVCRLGVEGDEEDIVIEGGHPEPSGDAYLRLASGQDDIVYKINRYGFEQLFPKGKAFFDLPGLSLDVKDIQGIEFTTPEGKVVLAKKDDEWTITEPKSDLPVVKSKLTSIASTLATWKSEDYADSVEGTGLEAPERSVTLHTAGDESHTIQVGRQSAHFDGYYARLDDNPRILAMTKSNMERIFVERKDLFERTLFDFTDDEIERIAITKDGETIQIDRTESGWKITAAQETFDADQNAVDDLAFALAGLQAEDLLFGAKRKQGGRLGALTLTLKDGAKHELNVEVEQDGGHPATVPGKATTFILSKDDLEEIMPTLDSLRVPEPEPEPEPSSTEESGAEAQSAEQDSTPPADETPIQETESGN